MSGNVAALVLIGTSLLNCAGALLNARHARRLRGRVDHAIADELRFRALLRCAGMVAFIANGPSGAPESLRRECAKILPPDIEITLHDVSGSVH